MYRPTGIVFGLAKKAKNKNQQTKNKQKNQTHLPVQSGGDDLCPYGAYQNLLFWKLFYSCSVQFLPLLPFFSSHFNITHLSLLGPVLSSPGTCILHPHAPRITQLWRKTWWASLARVILWIFISSNRGILQAIGECPLSLNLAICSGHSQWSFSPSPAFAKLMPRACFSFPFPRTGTSRMYCCSKETEKIVIFFYGVWQDLQQILLGT